jgi:hypothetical protein
MTDFGTDLLSADLLTPALANYSIPRISLDLHPGTMAFIVFCTALIVGILAGLVTLALYSERRKRSAAHHDEWIDGSTPASASTDDEDVEPFIPEDATSGVSASVEELFGTDASDASIPEPTSAGTSG